MTNTNNNRAEVILVVTFIKVIYFILSIPWKYQIGNKASLRQEIIERKKTKGCAFSSGIKKIRTETTANMAMNITTFKISIDETISEISSGSCRLIATSLVPVALNPKLITIEK
ncbi:MAG TPA: hypothetical protein PK816_15675 [Candidatus Cloacimonadota bacterium]|nr:hypothetical protein [Candidatus Cloacimonadota bacterium]